MREVQEVTGYPASAETERPADPMLELVPVKLFKDNNKYRDDVFVMVNGKTFVIQRGKEVMVPRYVKEVLDNSQRQDSEAAALIERFVDEMREAVEN